MNFKLALIATCLFPLLSGETMARADEPEGFTPCPREEINQALAQNITGKDLIDLLALERETLKLCAERAKLYNTLIEEDKKLQKLQGISLETETAGLSTSVAKPDLFKGENKSNSTSKTTVTTPAPPLAQSNSQNSSQAASLGSSLASSPTASVYNWYTLYGTGTDLTVGISDGQGNWLLKQGGLLPGDWKIVTIEAVPTKVVIQKGTTNYLLPYILQKVKSSNDPFSGDLRPGAFK